MGSLAPRRISRIAIIGAGPSGISAARYLKAENAFEKIDVFEKSFRCGGVWNPSVKTASSKTPVPQLDPNYDPVHGSTRTDYGQEADQSEDLFETPMYDNLETNIPKQLMQYANRPFADELPVFPSQKSVLEYCKDYAKDVEHLVRFGYEVTQVRAFRKVGAEDWSQTGWRVTTKTSPSSLSEEHIYDAIVVTNGHYAVPFIPAVKGIERWSSSYPGAITHSKAYKNPDPYTGKKVLLVGFAASGVDIGRQIAKVCKPKLLVSSRSEGIFSTASMEIDNLPEIIEFLDPAQEQRAVRFADGRVETHIDSVLYATGYLYSFPFFNLDPPLVTNGFRTRDIYQQIFHIEHPTLAFLSLPQRVSPFPLAENQAAIVARVWSSRLSLPSQPEMRAWDKTMLEERGDGKEMHGLHYPQDADYLQLLYDWAAKASPSYGLENDGQGLMATLWSEKQRWWRSEFPAIKAAFAELGEKRFEIKTIEALGFNFEEWKLNQEEGREYP